MCRAPCTATIPSPASALLPPVSVATKHSSSAKWSDVYLSEQPSTVGHDLDAMAVPLSISVKHAKGTAWILDYVGSVDCYTGLAEDLRDVDP